MPIYALRCQLLATQVLYSETSSPFGRQYLDVLIVHQYVELARYPLAYRTSGSPIKFLAGDRQACLPMVLYDSISAAHAQALQSVIISSIM